MDTTHVTPDWFSNLSRSDFDNGAVLDEIYWALKQREKMIEILKTLERKEGCEQRSTKWKERD